MEPVIFIDGLTKVYADGWGCSGLKALDSLSCKVEAGQVVGVLGGNGSGKSTLLKMLCGLLPIANGQVRVMGVEPPKAVLEGSIGYLPERRAYPDYLTPQKLLSHYGKLSGIEKGDLGSQVDGCIEQCGLGKVANQRIGKLSKGALQKLAMAQALIHDPTVLLLDEPMDGLDPLARKHAFRLIRTLKDEGKTVLLATHLIDGLEHCFDQLLILDRGRVIFQGPPAFEAGLEAWLVDRLHKQEAVYE